MRYSIDPFALGAFLLIALVIVGFASGKADAEKDDQEYCQMVREKRWPDYRGTYAQDCQGETQAKPR